MRHPVHAVIETPRASRVAGPQWFPVRDSRRFNPRHELFRRVANARHKALVAETDPGKVKTASRRRAGTVTMPDWIAARLPRGCRHTLARCLKAPGCGDSLQSL
jgi:hypothetical protein